MQKYDFSQWQKTLYHANMHVYEIQLILAVVVSIIMW